MMRYHEALSRCLEAVAAGGDLESVIAEMPVRHRDRLRADATLAQAVRDHATTLPPHSAEAEVNARSRLTAELSATRAARQAPASRGGAFLALPRFALAAVLLAALLIAASFVIAPNQGGNGTVEAAEFEGVVVGGGEGSLTVQTLDSLEEVMVPTNAEVIDEDGAALDLAALEPGEVVLVRGNREAGGPVRALAIRRRVDGLPGWCDENAERCRRIAENLQDARARCGASPEACHQLDERVTDLVARVTDVADLEDLKLRCREGGEDCRDITSFCRNHPDVCSHDLPPGPVADRIDVARERLQQLDDLCAQRDTRACRLIAGICQDHPLLCPDTPARDMPPETPVTDQRTR